MVFIITFLFSFLITITYSQNNTNTSESSSYVEEIISKEILLNIMYNQTEYDTIIIELYSPYCSHCRNFAPIYELIASTYQNEHRIKFIKLSSTNEDIWNETFPDVIGYPTLYMYNQEQLLKYEGLFEKEYVYNFLSKRNYECKEIETIEHFDNFITDNLIYPQYKRNKFIFGIIKDTEINKHKFNQMNIKNKDILYNDECFYYVYKDNELLSILNNDNLLNKNIFPFLLNGNVYNKNIIFTFNYDKGLNTYPFFDIDDNYEERYRLFLLKYYFPFSEEYNEDHLSELIKRGKRFLIFSYNTTSELEVFRSLANEFILTEKLSSFQREMYMILFVNVNVILEMDESLFKYANFGKYIGVYVAREQFYSYKSLGSTENGFTSSDVEKIVFDDVLDLINKDINDKTNSMLEEEENIDESDNIEINNEIIEDVNENKEEVKDSKELDNNELINKNDDIIDDMFKEVLGEDDEIFNTKIVMFPIYVLIYTCLFIYIYRKYLYKIFDEEQLHLNSNGGFERIEIKHN